jgi:hypothetical protein
MPEHTTSTGNKNTGEETRLNILSFTAKFSE